MWHRRILQENLDWQGKISKKYQVLPDFWGHIFWLCWGGPGSASDTPCPDRGLSEWPKSEHLGSCCGMGIEGAQDPYDLPPESKASDNQKWWVWVWDTCAVWREQQHYKRSLSWWQWRAPPCTNKQQVLHFCNWVGRWLHLWQRHFQRKSKME